MAWTENDVANAHRYVVGGTTHAGPRDDDTVKAFVARVVAEKRYSNFSVTVDGTPVSPTDEVVSSLAKDHDISVGPKEVAGN